MTPIYSPSEDSYLLTNILKRELPSFLNENPNFKFLEIGTGSGIHLETASSAGVKKENIFSSDIDSRAVSHCNLLGFHCVESDLFEKIQGKFDLIIFNPPYLPVDKFDNQPDTSGGKKGHETILRFLKQASEHLDQGGKIFLVASSLTPQIDFENLGYNSTFIGSERLFYEELRVWELTQ